jgi:D-lactate dehydrogenase (cytochrome)
MGRLGEHRGEIPSEIIAALLRNLLGDRLSANLVVRETHGRGEGLRAPALPELVAFPKSNAEVAAILELCNRTRTPVIPFGVGTSLEGQVAAVHGGVCIDLSGMNEILSFSADDMDCRVQAGVTRSQLNGHVRDSGFFFPLDPGAYATLGGMASTRASGTNAVRYGTMREVTLGLTVVTPQGDIIRTGGRARKSSAGYDLTKLYIGAEGTLGVITELQLRVFGVPERIAAATCQFPSLKSAVAAVMAALQIGLPLARIELADELQMRACIRYSHLEGMQEKPTLFLEFHGTPATVDEQIAQMREITEGLGADGFCWAGRPEDRSRLWKARHDVYHANLALKPGCEGYATDACVPISSLAECILASRALADESGLLCPIVGHVGDGNFHMLVLHDPNDPAERHRAETLAFAVARLAQDLGGTCTGEHGIGLHKLDLLVREHGQAVKVMQSIKAALDPNNIMNPGKTLPSGEQPNGPQCFE